MSRKDARSKRAGGPQSRSNRSRGRLIGLIAGGGAVLAVCIAVRYYWSAENASAQDRQPRATTARRRTTPSIAPTSPMSIVAEVNGEKIRRQHLANECIEHYGHAVLQSLINKHLILQHCKAKGISISSKEVDAEIDRMARRFGLPVDRWLQMLKEERDLNIEQYRRDVIWPTLALRKLAAARLKVTDRELVEAFEQQYGARVKVRMIGIRGSLTNQTKSAQAAAKAKRVHAEAVANPEDFGRLAKRESDDPESASVNGWIPPIRKHASEKEIEKVAFSLAPGEVSPIIKIRDQYIILLCEGTVPAQNISLQAARPRIEEMITDRKLRAEAAELFKQLQDAAQVVVVLADEKLKQKYPGVAAMINGRRITLRYLAEECIVRHGKDALGGLVNRRILEQELRRHKVMVTPEAIEAEVLKAAERMVPPKNGKVDRAGWIRQVTSEDGVTEALYIRDAVWPSVALELMTQASIKVTEEDIRQAYQANYGPRVRALAIVIDDDRTAKKVWQMARKKPGAEYFGKLSQEYSTDGSVRALNGEIAPIQLHGGHPNLENEAFALKEGEMSGIIQSGGKLVILLCTGWTNPQDIKPEAVRNELYNHIHGQKLRAAMRHKFDALQQAASVDNYLDPSASHQPPKRKLGSPAAARTARRTRPAKTR